MKKAILTTAICTLAIVTAAACGCGGNKKITYQQYDSSTVSFNDNSDKALAKYNDSLYYLNEWKVGYQMAGQSGDYFPDMADPIIIYDEGYYYAFGTRDCTVYQCFRSADLTNWTRLDDAYVPESDSWSRTHLYAPDIEKIGDKWYLYYTATPDNQGENHCQLGVAIADHVYGPYKQYTGTNANGEEITLSDPAFKGMEKHQVLDANVFQDGGKLYMYFSYDTKTPESVTSKYSEMSKDQYAAEIWGVELKDPVTWDLSTITPLISPGYKTYDAPKRTIEWETWSNVPGLLSSYGILEGPEMLKVGGKYILTYSANLYEHDCYAVGYAVSDSPLGNYVKPDDTYLQNMILGVPGAPGTGIANYYKGFTKGTGHAGIFQTPSGEYMFSYHAHFNRLTWGNTGTDNWRALAIDYIYFDENGLPYTNGPTYSLQSKPEHISGYKNLAGNATIRAEGENAQYLNDNLTNRTCREVINPNFPHEEIKEAEFDAGTRSIEIKFDAPVKVKAVNVFNSCDYSMSVMSIDQIDFGNGKGIVNALFNQRYFSTVTEEYIFPHCAFNIELGEEIETDRIVITITCEHDFALGEIEVLGKTN